MSEQIPEYYSDIFTVSTNPWGMSITFGLSASKPGAQSHEICTVRVSHETAKVISMMLRNQLKTYERETDTKIALPNKVLNDLSIAPEDW